jgi:hypothetical protein
MWMRLGGCGLELERDGKVAARADVELLEDVREVVSTVRCET